jgi:hypothetical protein
MQFFKERKMTEERADKLAETLGGYAWNSGGGVWLVIVERADSHLVTLSDEVICEYENQDAMDENRVLTSILLV